SAGEVLARHSLDPVPPLPRPFRSARAPLRAPAPERLERAVTKALAKEPADRFATAGEFAEALAEALAGAPASRASATLGALLRAFGAPRSRRRAALVALLLALLGAGVLGLGGVLWQRSHRAGAAAAAVSASTPERAGPKRVAVLSFENVGRPEDEYFADGMADEVRGKLASLPGIGGIASASSS